MAVVWEANGVLLVTIWRIWIVIRIARRWVVCFINIYDADAEAALLCPQCQAFLNQELRLLVHTSIAILRKLIIYSDVSSVHYMLLRLFSQLGRWQFCTPPGRCYRLDHLEFLLANRAIESSDLVEHVLRWCTCIVSIFKIIIILILLRGVLRKTLLDPMSPFLAWLAIYLVVIERNRVDGESLVWRGLVPRLWPLSLRGLSQIEQRH